ncbi:MAG TPA: hypothetical protein VN734_01820 [Acidobacteriaceae bacterium]|nr:hypothetical protein [Acidobacteriaceae bacterium]
MTAASQAEKPRALRHSLSQDLHDLSQPLTRLQWRLELGRRGGEAELRETIEGALADSLELTEWVRRIRVRIEGTEGRAA